MTETTFSPQLLSGKRILITGGGTGLGRGVARHLVDHGAEVHLWGRREAVLSEAAAEASASRPGSVHFHTVDVRDYDNVDETMGRIWDDHGPPLTGVVNNAAANFIAQTKDLSPPRLLRNHQHRDERFLPHHARRWKALDRRRIAGFCPFDAHHLGMDGGVGVRRPLGHGEGSRSLDDDVAGRRVGQAQHPRQCRCPPGPIPTDYAWEMLNPTDKSSVGATQADQIPAGRTGTMEELANLTMFLLSDACDYLTGQTIAMDGGSDAGGPPAPSPVSPT